MREQTKKLRDVAARLKQTEQVLQVSEIKYRQLVENADCIILRMDTTGRISFFNEFAQKFFGYSEREVLGKNIIGTITPKTDMSCLNFAKIAKAIRRYPERYTTYENEYTCKDGRHVWVAWANKIIRSKQNRIAEIQCVGHDITERKRTENELRLLAAVVHNSNDAITLQDLKGKIISWNLGAEQMYGYSKAEAINLNADRLIPEYKQDEMLMLMRKLEKNEKADGFETVRLAKDGRVLHVSLTATRLKNEKGKPFAAAIFERDITERKNLEKEILEITDRERHLIGQEMHDSMGQILTGIALKSKSLSLKLKDKSLSDSKGALAISKLANLATAQMRDLARMLHPVDIEAGGLITALGLLASGSEKILDVNCRFQYKKPISVNNLIEAKQLYRIAQESITNAAKHGKAKNILIELHSTGNFCVLSVSNDGLHFQLSPPKKKDLD